MTSQLSAALRAAAAGIHPDEAGTGLIISHGAFLHRGDFTSHVETAACISDGTPMAWIDWDAVVTALDSGHLPASGGEQRIVRIAASLAVGHPVSLRDAIPGLDQHNLHLVTTAMRRAAGQRWCTSASAQPRPWRAHPAPAVPGWLARDRTTTRPVCP